MRTLVLATLIACGGSAPPVEPVHNAPAPARDEPVDLMIVLDMSKSMEDTDIAPDRLGAAKTALQRLVTDSAHDRIGLVAFGQQPKVLAKVTADHAAVVETIGRLSIGDVPELGTAIGDGLALAVQELRSAGKRKVVVLFADGDNNWVTRYDPEQAAQLAASEGVTVHTVLVGPETGADTFGGASTNPATLKAIAATTHGTYHAVTSAAAFDTELRAVITAIHAPPR